MTARVFMPYKVSAVHRSHLALGARWVEEGEWRLPESFAAPEIEARQVKEAVGLQDVSESGKLDLKGREVEWLVAGLGPERLSVLRLTPEHLLLLTPAGLQTEIAEALFRALSGAQRCAHVTDVTGALSAFAVVGPKARELLARLTSLDLRPHVFPDGACAQGGLANVHSIVLREDWGSLPAYRLLLQRELAEYAWGAIREAGASFGLIPFGLAAERLLRGKT